MVYDTDYREVAMAAIDTAYPVIEQGANTRNGFTVPSTVSKLTAVRIGLGAIGTDVIVGVTSAIKISGTGLKVPELFLVGPMIAAAGAAATDGGFSQAEPMLYKTNIGVKPGNTIDVTAFVHGEDIGAAHILVEFEYDGIPGRITGGDYREESTGAAANTLVTLARRGDVAAQGVFKPTGPIIEIVFGAILDPVGHATDGLLVAPALHLTGNGLQVNGEYKVIGQIGQAHPDTDVVGTGAISVNPSRRECGAGIPIKVNGEITAQAQNIESIQAIHAIVGLLY